MINRSTPQRNARHALHADGRHSAERPNGRPVSALVPVPPQYHGGRHRAGLFARLTRTAR
ncbi:hypothetical protein GCM10009559_59470 [Pseudonocardia zijingensis]|uniref:Uncharacterized protein n=1 Tax=Pseudonocardia zijingensis TaxID=153376 RepID=A0ABN1NA65_9PSEU